MNILKLIRFPNLIMLALMQFLLRYALSVPITEAEGKPHLLSTLEFALLVFSCVCVAAGGYIINDIEDIEIDTINKPGKVLPAKLLSANLAYNLYLFITITGIAAGFLLKYYFKVQYVGIINAVAAGLLYFYATGYKCIPVLGNIVIAGLTAFAVWLTILPEPWMMNDAAVLSITAGYIVFAFLMTFIRELVKDIEDVHGDRACGCNTLPVATGLTLPKWISFALVLLVFVLITGIQYSTHQWESPLHFYYLLLTVNIPLLILAYFIAKANRSTEWHRVSMIIKFIMLTGILSMAVFYLSF